MAGIKEVFVLFNPNSTGDARALAEELQKHAAQTNLHIELVETKYAGHARELAEGYASKKKNVALYASSGDGGYNELIDGIMHSMRPETISGVLPGGNANDHYAAVHRSKDIVQRLIANEFETIDCIEVKVGNTTRYAHSYVGLGVTPQIGIELTKSKLNILKEAWIVLRRLFTITPVLIRQGTKTYRYDHLVISNIPKMSKYIVVGPESSTTDGKLELNTVQSGSFLRMLQHFIDRMFRANHTPNQIETFSFICLRGTSLQLDGEIMPLKANQSVTITCIPRALRIIT